MTRAPQGEVTQLLARWREGEQEAFDRLLPLVEGQLRRLARRHMRRERANHTLQTTALLNEAYLRLVRQTHVEWQNRAHFLAIASRSMRRVLLDHAKSVRRAKRGGGVPQVTLDEGSVLSPERSEQVLALEAALVKLEATDPRRSRVVEMRHFGGLTAEEIAHVLGVSTVTVLRDWRLAKAWLVCELDRSPKP